MFTLFRRSGGARTLYQIVALSTALPGCFNGGMWLSHRRAQKIAPARLLTCQARLVWVCLARRPSLGRCHANGAALANDRWLAFQAVPRSPG